MKKKSFRWAVVGGMIVLIIMFGIDVATQGVERVYGSLADDQRFPAGRLADVRPASQTDQSRISDSQIRDSQINQSQTQGQTQSQTDESRIQPSQADDNQLEQRPVVRKRIIYETVRPRLTVGEAARSRERGEYMIEEEPEVVYEEDRLPGIPDTRQDSKVNKLADGTAGVLQSLSSQGIRMVVNFFEAVTD